MPPPNQNGDLETDGFGAWESSDGRTWTATTSGLPEDRWIHGTAQGNKGILAHVSMARAEFGSELWFSVDGRSWEMVRGFANGIIEMDAGDEGFVVAGRMGPYGEPGVPFAIASADGSEWFESAAPPTEVVDVAALEGDWIALSLGRRPGVQRVHVRHVGVGQWLDWSRAEEIRFHDSGPARTSAAGWSHHWRERVDTRSCARIAGVCAAKAAPSAMDLTGLRSTGAAGTSWS